MPRKSIACRRSASGATGLITCWLRGHESAQRDRASEPRLFETSLHRKRPSTHQESTTLRLAALWRGSLSALAGVLARILVRARQGGRE